MPNNATRVQSYGEWDAINEMLSSQTETMTRSYIKGLRAAAKICYELKDHNALTIATRVRERADNLAKRPGIDLSFDTVAMLLSKEEMKALVDTLNDLECPSIVQKLVKDKIELLAFLWGD